MSPMQHRQYDTIVVGMGAAGAGAASRLARAGLRVLAIDAQGYVGGRVRTARFGDGVVEMGAEWIHGERKNPVYELAKQYRIPLKLTNNGSKVFLSDGSVGDHRLVQELVDYSFEVLHENPKKNDTLKEYMTRKILAYLKKHRPEILNNTDFLDELLELFELIYNDLVGTNNWKDASAETRYRELPGSQDWSWHQLGYKTLFDILLNNYSNGSGLPNLHIKLDTEVTKIKWPKNPKNKVQVKCKNGKTFSAKTVIVTVSVGVLKERHKKLFRPPLPKEKSDAIEVIPLGVVAKILLSFPERWWPLDHNTSTYLFIWSKEDKKAIPKEYYWTTKISEITIPMGADNVLELWTTGNAAKLVERLPEGIVQRQAVALLQRFMGGNRTVPEPNGMVRSSWYSNPFTVGSYSFDSVLLLRRPQSRAALAMPVRDTAGSPRVLFAGEATHDTAFGTVHGALLSGYREAQRILDQN